MGGVDEPHGGADAEREAAALRAWGAGLRTGWVPLAVAGVLLGLVAGPVAVAFAERAGPRGAGVVFATLVAAAAFLLVAAAVLLGGSVLLARAQAAPFDRVLAGTPDVEAELVGILRDGPHGPYQLAGSLGVDRATVTRALRRLEVAGQVRREGSLYVLVVDA